MPLYDHELKFPPGFIVCIHIHAVQGYGVGLGLLLNYFGLLGLLEKDTDHTAIFSRA